MAVDLDREGDFQVQCIEYGLFNAPSKSVAVNMKFKVLAAWDDATQDWVDWQDADVEVEGSFWIIKKPKEGQLSGELNDSQIEALCKHCGWNASLKAIAEGTWTPTDCQVNVKYDEYQSKRLKRDVFRAAFLNAFDAIPGGRLGNISTDEATALELQFGSRFRALAANSKTPQKPNGKPNPPTKKAPATSLKSMVAEAEAVQDGREIPF